MHISIWRVYKNKHNRVMTTTAQSVFELGGEFNRAGFRLCEIDGIKHASVLDVIAAFSKDGNHARMIWKRLKENTDTVYRYNTTRFAGQRSSSPVADAETLMLIICRLDGPKADKFRLAGAQGFLSVLDPTREFISELTERRDALTDGQGRSSAFLVDGGDKEMRLAPHVYNQTWLYVRVRLPEGCLRANLQNPKQLTLAAIKFGIAYSMQDRNSEYLRDPDNAYMMFGFQCLNRYEAEIVENILKHDFRDITVFGSREYVDSVRLADALEVTNYAADKYTDYVKLAEKLFTYMVNVIRRNWPKKYPTTWGVMFNVVENALPPDASSTPSSRLGVELSYPCQAITCSQAAQMGMTTDAQQLLEMRLKYEPSSILLPPVVRDTPSIASVASVASVVPSPAVVTETSRRQDGGDGRSHGIIVSHDLISGEEVEYDNAEQAANACGISPSALRRTFVDFPSQLQGKHWRKKGMPFWVPPEGFVFDPAHYEKSHGKAVRATNASANEVRIFESRVAAAKILRCNKPRSLTDYIGTGKTFLGFVWTDVSVAEYGTWSASTTSADRTPPTTAAPEDAGINGRCNGKIIARDLTTGVEVLYDSATRAGAFNNISKHSLDDNFIDKPRQVRGKHFRSFTATRYWRPPSYFKFDATLFEKKTNGYVVSVDEVGGITAMYESVKAAAQLEGRKVWSIQQYLNSGKAYNGRVWRSATAEEYDVWHDV